MTEKEVLEKLDFFKQAIQKLKEERDFWKEQAEENPQEVCETEGWVEAWKTLNEERLKDAETIAELRTKCEDFSNDFTDADLECDRLKAELERADSAYAKLAHMYNEKGKDVDSDKKYTEEDLKKLLQKATEKAKTSLKAQEEEIDRLNTKLENLELTNRSLENELNKREASDEIDKVLEGEMTEKEMDEILTANSAEEQEVIKNLLTKPTKVVKLNV